MRLALTTWILLIAGAVPAVAQTAARNDPPIGRGVIDARLFVAGFGADAVTATDLGIPVEVLPSRGPGFVIGATVYPLRRSGFALGLGGEMLLARARTAASTTEAGSVFPAVERRLLSFTAQLSLNFGHRDGWSYLTGGVGPFRFESFTGDTAPTEAPAARTTINLGGGARWFMKRHVALNLDVRFYLTRPEPAVGTIPGRSRQRILVLSAGISLR